MIFPTKVYCTAFFKLQVYELKFNAGFFLPFTVPDYCFKTSAHQCIKKYLN
jgi:hypothetical protein